MDGPKSTFYNLPAGKQRQFLEAALREFAARGYQKASLNTLVRELGIAKGSIYRYFANKEALFRHLFEDFVVQVKKAVKEAVRPAEQDFFDQVRAVFLAGIRFIDQNPLYYRLYLQVLFDEDIPGREELLARIRLFSADYFMPLCRACQKKGEIRSDLPAAIIIFTIDALLDRFLQGYACGYLDGGLALSQGRPEELRDHIDSFLIILRDGLTPPGNERKKTGATR